MGIIASGSKSCVVKPLFCAISGVGGEPSYQVKPLRRAVASSLTTMGESTAVDKLRDVGGVLSRSNFVPWIRENTVGSNLTGA